MTQASELSEELRAAIGVEGAPVVREVTAPGIRTFARALGYQNPVYYDEALARAQGHPALPAPPGFYGTAVYDPRAVRRPARPGASRAFRRALEGGMSLEPLARVYAGDVLEAVTTLASVELREGRLGPMVIRTLTTVYTRRGDGAVVARASGTEISY